MRYNVIQIHEDLELFIRLINAAMADGWRPCGGLIAFSRVAFAQGVTVYAQALLKDESLSNTVSNPLS